MEPRVRLTESGGSSTQQHALKLALPSDFTWTHRLTWGTANFKQYLQTQKMKAQIGSWLRRRRKSTSLPIRPRRSSRRTSKPIKEIRKSLCGNHQGQNRPADAQQGTTTKGSKAHEKEEKDKVKKMKRLTQVSLTAQAYCKEPNPAFTPRSAQNSHRWPHIDQMTLWEPVMGCPPEICFWQVAKIGANDPNNKHEPRKWPSICRHADPWPLKWQSKTGLQKLPPNINVGVHFGGPSCLKNLRPSPRTVHPGRLFYPELCFKMQDAMQAVPSPKWVPSLPSGWPFKAHRGLQGAFRLLWSRFMHKFTA